MRAVSRRIVHTSAGATARAASVRTQSRTSIRPMISVSWNNGSTQAWTPKIMTSWMALASFMARKIMSPVERVAWKPSERARRWASILPRSVWIMYSAVRA